MPNTIFALALAGAALVLTACGQKAEKASAPQMPAATGAASDAAAMAPVAPATEPPPAPASSAVSAGPGTGPEGYNSPAPMSNPTSATGQNNPPSDVLGPR